MNIGVTFQERNRRGDFVPIIDILKYGFTSFMDLLSTLADSTSDLFSSAVDAMIVIKDSTDVTIWCQGNDPDTLQPYADTIMNHLNFQHHWDYDPDNDCIRLSKTKPVNVVGINDLTQALAMDFDAIKADLDSR